MNYQKHYDRLIERARVREKPGGYCERHHVIPRCLGGSDEPNNLVYLTAREHYVAHVLLAKMSGDYRAWCAVKQMGALRNRQNSKIYSTASEKHAAEARARFLGDLNPSRRDYVRAKMSASQRANPVWLGKKRSDHSERMTGGANPAFGRSSHSSAIVEHAKSRTGKSLEEFYGEEKATSIRKSLSNSHSACKPFWILKTYLCHCCGKEIISSGNLSQHLFKSHGLKYSEFKSVYN